MTLLNWVAVIVVILTIAALVKRYETRLVLFTSYHENDGRTLHLS